MKNKKILKIGYIIIVLFICIIPSAGLLFVKPQISETENRKLSEMPVIVNDDGINEEWLGELGNYFQEHFAFRNEMVDTNARLMSTFLGVSADEAVITGKEGWLYYADSLDDYLGQNLLDDRSLFNVAHSMKLMQIYAQMSGIQFLYVPVPNKNTLYGDNMPYYYRYKVSDDRNLERLYEMLDKEGVHYLNLLEAFSVENDVLYHKTDSHWTNEGAAYAADLMMDILQKPRSEITNHSYEVRTDFQGDLQGMLYPVSGEKEEEKYYDYEFSYEYLNEISSTFDPKLQTVNENGSGNLIMYRDSFGNALIPFVSECFETAYYSRSVPYPMNDLNLYDVDTLIVERAERFIEDTAMNPPIMAGLMLPNVPVNTKCVDEYSLSLEENKGLVSLCTDGMYYRLEGVLDPELCDMNSTIYVSVNDNEVYEAFPVTVVDDDGMRNSYGYRLYMPMTEVQEFKFEIYVSDMELAILEMPIDAVG